MKKRIIETGAAFICVMTGIYGVNLFNRYILMSLPMYVRVLSRLFIYWVIALVPLVLMIVNKRQFTSLQLIKQSICRQIITGVLLALAMSGLLTLLPHLVGLGENVDNGCRYVHLWQYVYEFFYSIAAVSAVEELVFRGYFYVQFKAIFSKESAAILGSSVLFGLAHIFQGNILQVFMTMLLGILFCVMRLKIKNCSLLSLIIAHGIYDALISVWASLLLK